MTSTKPEWPLRIARKGKKDTTLGTFKGATSIMPIFPASSQVNPSREMPTSARTSAPSCQLKSSVCNHKAGQTVEIQRQYSGHLKMKMANRRRCRPDHNNQTNKAGTPLPIKRSHVTGSGRSRLGRWAGLSRRNRHSGKQVAMTTVNGVLRGGEPRRDLGSTHDTGLWRAASSHSSDEKGHC